jgi:hypothetical protein
MPKQPNGTPGKKSPRLGGSAPDIKSLKAAQQ